MVSEDGFSLQYLIGADVIAVAKERLDVFFVLRRRHPLGRGPQNAVADQIEGCHRAQGNRHHDPAALLDLLPESFGMDTLAGGRRRRLGQGRRDQDQEDNKNQCEKMPRFHFHKLRVNGWLLSADSFNFILGNCRFRRFRICRN